MTRSRPSPILIGLHSIRARATQRERSLFFLCSAPPHPSPRRAAASLSSPRRKTGPMAASDAAIPHHPERRRTLLPWFLAVRDEQVLSPSFPSLAVAGAHTLGTHARSPAQAHERQTTPHMLPAWLRRHAMDAWMDLGLMDGWMVYGSTTISKVRWDPAFTPRTLGAWAGRGVQARGIGAAWFVRRFH